MTIQHDVAWIVSLFEPYVVRAYWSRGRWLIGYGGPTEGPDERPVEQDMMTTHERALSNLTARMAPIRAIAIREATADVWNKLGREQQAALGSLVWSYGFLPISIDPDVERTALSIEARSADFNGRERDRRKLESNLFMGATTWADVEKSSVP